MRRAQLALWCALCALCVVSMQNAGVNAQADPPPALDPDEGPFTAGQCETCRASEYLDFDESIERYYCAQCPDNSFTDETQSNLQISISDCACNQGYYEIATGDPCEKCAHGTYKSADLDDSACLLCSAFSLFMTTAEEASTASIDCLCRAGYYHEYTEGPAVDDCLQCAAGTFKESIGNEVTPCVECGVDTYCPSPSTVETDCPGNSQAVAGSTQLSDCHCNVGFYKDDTLTDIEGTDVLISRVCRQCAAGTYQDTVDSPNCEDCPAGKYNELLQQDEETDCLQCDSTFPDRAGSAAGSSAFSDCFCNAGHEHDSGSAGTSDLYVDTDDCSPCAAGKYRTVDMQSDGSAYDYLCTECGPDKYNVFQASTSETACTDCPANSHTTNGATGQDKASNCHCEVGYEQTVEGTLTELPTCDECTAGKFSSTVDAGISSCTDCLAGKASNTLGATSESTCIACNPGTISAFDGAVSCTDCGNDQYQVGTGESICTDCPAPTGHAYFGQDNLAACECNEGYTAGVGDAVCVQCAPGTYKDQPRSNALCTACTSVDANSHSPVQSDHLNDCFCNAGYYATPVANGLVNDASSLGLRPDLSDNNACEVCPPGHYCGPDVNAAGFNQPPYPILGYQRCRDNSNSPEESSHFTHCKCNAGFYFDTVANGAGDNVANEFTACSLCRTDLNDQGFYCPPDNDDAISCGLNTASHSTHDGVNPRASQYEDCVCLAGYWRNCIACDEGINCMTGFNGTRHILDGDELTDDTEGCHRDKTYFESDCVQCPSDTACKQEEQMQHCPLNSESPLGSDDREDCKCTAGFKEVAQPPA